MGWLWISWILGLWAEPMCYSRSTLIIYLYAPPLPFPHHAQMRFCGHEPLVRDRQSCWKLNTINTSSVTWQTKTWPTFYEEMASLHVHQIPFSSAFPFSTSLPSPCPDGILWPWVSWACPSGLWETDTPKSSLTQQTENLFSQHHAPNNTFNSYF